MSKFDRVPASKPSFSQQNITMPAGNAAFGLIRGPNGRLQVQATHRVGGNLDADNNYLILTINAERWPGSAGNVVSVTITDGANRVRYRPGSNLIEIQHAANSLAGVKAAVDADGGRFITSSDVTGQGAQQPAAYTEHGGFSGGLDTITNTDRKIVFGTTQGTGTANPECQLIKTKSATAPADDAKNFISIHRFAQPIVIDLEGDDYLYGRMGPNTAGAAWIDEYTGDELVNFQPDIVRL